MNPNKFTNLGPLVYITHMGSENYWQAVAGNVRAEMARRKRTAIELMGILRMSRNSVYRRMNGEVPFDLGARVRIGWRGARR